MTLANLLDKRSRFAPSTHSLLAVCPIPWLLAPVMATEPTPLTYAVVVAPAVAALRRRLPVDQDRYGWEFKWDGVRAIAYVSGPGVRLISRNDREMAGSYPELGRCSPTGSAARRSLAGRSWRCARGGPISGGCSLVQDVAESGVGGRPGVRLYAGAFCRQGHSFLTPLFRFCELAARHLGQRNAAPVFDGVIHEISILRKAEGLYQRRNGFVFFPKVSQQPERQRNVVHHPGLGNILKLLGRLRPDPFRKRTEEQGVLLVDLPSSKARKLACPCRGCVQYRL